MMRRAAVVLVVLFVLVPACSQAESFHLILRPGTLVQSGSLGYSTGAMMFYGGFDLMVVSASYEFVGVETISDDWYDYDERYEWESSFSGSGMLIMPHIGLRYALGQGEVRPYVFGSAFKSFASVSAETDYTYRWYEDGELVDSGTGSNELPSDVEEAIESLLGFWGLNVGVGAEYEMSERFSLGAEFGVRMAFTSSSYDTSDEYSDEWEEWSSTWEQEASASLRMTYVALVLGFQL